MKRRELCLTPEEDRSLASLAEASGQSFQSYVIALVRGHLARKPQLGPHELRALHESNAHLVDLVQMMRKHQDPRVSGLAASIDGHLKEVKAMVVRNGRRFVA